MADTTQNEKEAGKSAAEIDVAAITKTVTAEVLKAVKDEYAPHMAKIEELEKNLETVATTVAKAPPANADEVSKLVRSEIEAASKAQSEAQQKAETRKAMIEKITAEKLGGNARLAELLTGDDEAALTASAEKVAATAKELKPDFASTRNDGGTTPGKSGGGTPIANVPENIAKYAQTIQLPK